MHDRPHSPLHPLQHLHAARQGPHRVLQPRALEVAEQEEDVVGIVLRQHVHELVVEVGEGGVAGQEERADVLRQLCAQPPAQQRAVLLVQLQQQRVKQTVHFKRVQPRASLAVGKCCVRAALVSRCPPQNWSSAP